MAKGGGSARLRWLVADPLEGRLLPSHAAGAAIVHALATPPVHMAPTPARPRPKAEPGHAAVNNGESRVAEVRAASRNGPTIPFLAPGRPRDGFNDPSGPAREVPKPARNPRVIDRKATVAWMLTVDKGSGIGPISGHRAAEASEIPESASRVIGGVRPGPAPSRPAEVEAPGVIPSPERSDLLADFLPSDREALDRAIDGLVDGLAGLGATTSGGAEATMPIPSPVAWGFTLAVLEAFRRYSGRRAGGEQDPDGGPGREFLASRG